MYTSHIRHSGMPAYRNTADILTMHHAAKSYSGTDKLKSLDTFFLLGHSSTAKLPDYVNGIWFNPEEMNYSQDPKSPYWQHLCVYSPHSYCWIFSFMQILYKTSLTPELCFNNSLQLSQLSPVKKKKEKSFLLWASFLTHLVLPVFSHFSGLVSFKWHDSEDHQEEFYYCFSSV